VSVCLRDGGEAEQIESAVLCAGRGGEDGGETIAPEADDVAGEGGEIAEQGVEAVHREWLAIRNSVRLRAALRRAAGEGSALATGEVHCASRAGGSGSSNSIGARLWRMCHSR
jgi:hypothetical protein